MSVCCCYVETIVGRQLTLRVPFYGSVTRADAVVTAADASRAHTLSEMQVSSSSAVTAEPPSLVTLPSSTTADATGRSSGDAASPGLITVIVSHITIIHVNTLLTLILVTSVSVLCLQCFDAVGWAAARASGL